VDSKSFLQEVWAAQPHEEGWVFLSIKRGDSWTDKALEWTSEGVRIPKLPRDADVYFCPNVFSEPERKRQFALPTVWLHADLDEVEPDAVALSPTTAWRTSKGRYQCLWRSTRPLAVKHFEALNQRLTYLTGADKGGWSVTKVLRVPGTLNHKRGKPQRVELMWDDLQHYLPKVVLNLVRDVKVVKQVGVKDLELPDITWDALYRRHKGILTTRARQLLRARKAVVGERSDRLWELEATLLECGVPREEVLLLVRGTVWNKYAGQRRELPQLWAEVCKAAENVGTRDKSRLSSSPDDGGVVVDRAEHRNGKVQEPGELSLVSYDRFLAQPAQAELWTVEGVWSYDAHGLIAGEPKTYKSLVATDLAVSVASGTPFLGRFEVPETGPVIIIQEENTVGMMKDRLEKIAVSRGIGGDIHKVTSKSITMSKADSLPIHLMNNKGLNLLDEDHVSWLEEQIRYVEPKLVVLDPLYLMIPGVDESSQVGVTPVLRDLLMLKQQYGVGILIVHHYNKPREEENRHPGYRITGSGVFYRWFESALYLEKGKEPCTVKMTPEHRGHAPEHAIHLEVDMGKMGDPYYHVEVDVRREEGTTGGMVSALLALVEEEPGITAVHAAKALGISRDRLMRLVKSEGFRVRKGKADGSRGRPSARIYLASER